MNPGAETRKPADPLTRCATADTAGTSRRDQHRLGRNTPKVWSPIMPAGPCYEVDSHGHEQQRQIPHRHASSTASATYGSVMLSRVLRASTRRPAARQIGAGTPGSSQTVTMALP